MRGAISLEFLQVFAAMMLIAAMLFGFYAATAGQLMGYSAKMFGSAAAAKLVKDVNFVCTYPYSERLVSLQVRNTRITISSAQEKSELTLADSIGKPSTYSTYCPVRLTAKSEDGEEHSVPEMTIKGDAALRITTSADGKSVTISQ